MVVENFGRSEIAVGNDTFEVKTIDPEDTKTHILRTDHRTICEAVLLWNVAPSGRDRMVMTHYHANHPDHPDVIRQQPRSVEGKNHAVILSAYGPSQELEDAVGEAAGQDPDIVTLGRPEDKILQYLLSPDLLQLHAVRTPEHRLIYVPTELGNYYNINDYEKEL
jgi:hypothetical protein